MRYFALRMLLEKNTERLKKLDCVFEDLEKAYDRLPKRSTGKSGVAEKYERVMQDM